MFVLSRREKTMFAEVATKEKIVFFNRSEGQMCVCLIAMKEKCVAFKSRCKKIVLLYFATREQYVLFFAMRKKFDFFNRDERQMCG